jgi:hypothetical protein
MSVYSRETASTCSIRVALRVRGVDRHAAEAAVRALSPDDRTAPSWLQVRESVDDSGLAIEVLADHVPCTRLGSVRNTVDEILEFLYALLKTLEETAKTLKGRSSETQQ